MEVETAAGFTTVTTEPTGKATELLAGTVTVRPVTVI
jgi:hypothetical protein